MGISQSLRMIMDKLSKSQEKAVAAQAAQFPLKAEREAKASYPSVLKNRSGASGLMGSIKGFSRGVGKKNWTMGLRNDKAYAAAQEYGAHIPPHGIAAVNAKALKFVINGQTFFRKRVHHPGGYIKPKKFLSTPLYKAGKRLIEDIRKVVGFSG